MIFGKLYFLQPPHELSMLYSASHIPSSWVQAVRLMPKLEVSYCFASLSSGLLRPACWRGVIEARMIVTPDLDIAHIDMTTNRPIDVTFALHLRIVS